MNTFRMKTVKSAMIEVGAIDQAGTVSTRTCAIFESTREQEISALKIAPASARLAIVPFSIGLKFDKYSIVGGMHALVASPDLVGRTTLCHHPGKRQTVGNFADPGTDIGFAHDAAQIGLR